MQEEGLGPETEQHGKIAELALRPALEQRGRLFSVIHGGEYPAMHHL